MLNLYTSPSCASCRKVKKYFDTHQILYTEKNILSHKLTKDDIIKMLMKSENGFEDIISTRSKIIKEQNIDIDSMRMNELVEFIVQNPTILKRPIIMAEEEIQVGFNDDDITLFLPEELRDRECFNCLGEEDCEYKKALKEMKF